MTPRDRALADEPLWLTLINDNAPLATEPVVFWVVTLPYEPSFSELSHKES